MSAEIWTPGKQQQSEVGIGINDLGPTQTVLVVSAGPVAFQIAMGPLESIEAFAGVILQTAKQVRAKRALVEANHEGSIPISA